MYLHSLVTNSYELKARLYPALLLIAPIIVTGFVLFFDNLDSLFELQPLFLAVIVIFGGGFLLTQITRDYGKNKEQQLSQKWGGMPSMKIFRHSDQHLNTATKIRYHMCLAKLVEGTNSPTAEQEETDSITADEIYLTWSNYLRAHTRDTMMFNLIHRENINYGYRRNVWAMKPIGVTVSLVVLLVSVVRIFYIYQATFQFDGHLIAAGVFSTFMLAIWLVCFSIDWVRVAADAYAERLAESVEILFNKSDGNK